MVPMPGTTVGASLDEMKTSPLPLRPQTHKRPWGGISSSETASRKYGNTRCPFKLYSRPGRCQSSRCLGGRVRIGFQTGLVFAERPLVRVGGTMAWFSYSGYVMPAAKPWAGTQVAGELKSDGWAPYSRPRRPRGE